MKLPVNYDELTPARRREVRNRYISLQDGKCLYCGESLSVVAPERITKKPLKLYLFPPGFLKHPIHLQHNHSTGMTEGAVHNYCNAVMWQYEGR